MFVSRDVKFGVGTSVKSTVWRLEQRAEIEKIIIVAPETFPVKTAKVEFVIVPIIGKFFATKEPLFCFMAARAVSKYLRKEKDIDVVHLHTNILPFYRPEHTVVVSTFHSTHKGAFSIPAVGMVNNIGKFLHIPYSAFDWIRMLISDHLSYVSHRTGEELCKMIGFGNRSAVFIPNGVDTHIYTMHPAIREESVLKHHFPDVDFADKRVLFHVGRLEPGKGFESSYLKCRR